MKLTVSYNGEKVIPFNLCKKRLNKFGKVQKKVYLCKEEQPKSLRDERCKTCSLFDINVIY